MTENQGTAMDRHLIPRIPSWGPIVISLLLLGIAAWRLGETENQAMAGVVIGVRGVILAPRAAI